MSPFFFGSDQRRLFGLYTPGQSFGGGNRAAVICPPWGPEYQRAHRSLKHLSTLLSRAGVHVLRFDYFGTGDSAGQMCDGDLQGWEADVEAAIEEIKDVTSAPRVELVGLRLGGTIAARVAARRDDVNLLVLWDPVVLGDEYLSDLETAVAQNPIVGVNAWSAATTTGGREVLGFILTDRLEDDIRLIDLLTIVPSLPHDTRVVVTQPLPSHVSLRSLRPVTAVACPPFWNSAVGVLPVVFLKKVEECFRPDTT